MPHEHNVYDMDLRFVINPVTRQIENRSGKVIIMQHDHNSECFSFELPRQIDGHDMSLCDHVEIHYINYNNQGIRFEGSYIVNDLHVDDEDDGKVVCSWVISENATGIAGSLNFILKFICVDNDRLVYAWHTGIYRGITISEVINSQNETNDYDPIYVQDILSEWESRISSLEEEVITNRNKYKFLAFDNVEDLQRLSGDKLCIFIWTGDEHDFVHNINDTYGIIEMTTSFELGDIYFGKYDLVDDTYVLNKVSNLFDSLGSINLENYVEKETGKSLSTNDYTNSDKQKLDSIIIPVLETHGIEQSAWTSLSSSDPYKYSATVTITNTLTSNNIVRLINDQPILFANYGFAISAINGQTATIIAIEQPNTNITLYMEVR